MPNPVFKLQASKRILIFLFAIIVCCCIVILALALPFWLRVLAMVFISLYGIKLIRETGFLKGKQAITQLEWREEGWHISTQTHTYIAQLQGDSTVTPLFAILRFKVADFFLIKSCLICPDSLPKDQYRALLLAVKRH